MPKVLLKNHEAMQLTAADKAKYQEANLFLIKLGESTVYSDILEYLTKKEASADEIREVIKWFGTSVGLNMSNETHRYLERGLTIESERTRRKIKNFIKDTLQPDFLSTSEGVMRILVEHPEIFEAVRVKNAGHLHQFDTLDISEEQKKAIFIYINTDENEFSQAIFDCTHGAKSNGAHLKEAFYENERHSEEMSTLMTLTSFAASHPLVMQHLEETFPELSQAYDKTISGNRGPFFSLHQPEGATAQGSEREDPQNISEDIFKHKADRECSEVRLFIKTHRLEKICSETARYLSTSELDQEEIIKYFFHKHPPKISEETRTYFARDLPKENPSLEKEIKAFAEKLETPITLTAEEAFERVFDNNPEIFQAIKHKLEKEKSKEVTLRKYRTAGTPPLHPIFKKKSPSADVSTTEDEPKNGKRSP